MTLFLRLAGRKSMKVLLSWLSILTILQLGLPSAKSQTEPDATHVSTPLDAANSGSNIEAEIRRLDRRTLLELVELAKFNVGYQQKINHVAKWRNIVYPLAQESAYACLLGYTATDLSQEARGWRNPSLLSERSIKRGLSSAMIGSIIGGLSSTVELAANGVETVKADRQGISARKSIAFVHAQLNKINDLLDTRHQLMLKVKADTPQHALLHLKEDLLKYERDRLVFEFKRWNAHSRSYAWYKNSFYVINSTVNMLRLSAIIVGFKSITSKKCGGAVGPMLITSSCIASSGPFLSNKFANFIESRQKKNLEQEFPGSMHLSEEEARAKLQNLAKLLDEDQARPSKHPVLQELAKLREESLGLDTLIFHQTKKIEHIRLVAGQQARTAPLASSLALGSGILNTVGYHAYRAKPLINNRLGLAGDTAVVAAEAIALCATPAAAIQAVLYERKLKKRNENPEQLLHKRMENLQRLETILLEENKLR